MVNMLAGQFCSRMESFIQIVLIIVKINIYISILKHKHSTTLDNIVCLWRQNRKNAQFRQAIVRTSRNCIQRKDFILDNKTLKYFG